jgi:hypothetical protein
MDVVWYPLETTANASERSDTLEPDMVPLNFPCGKINTYKQFNISPNFNLSTTFIFLKTHYCKKFTIITFNHCIVGKSQ